MKLFASLVALAACGEVKTAHQLPDAPDLPIDAPDAASPKVKVTVLIENAPGSGVPTGLPS